MLLILCYYSDEYSLINLINHGVFVCHQSDVINYNKNGASVCWLSVFNFQTNKLTQLVNYATITIFFCKITSRRVKRNVQRNLFLLLWCNLFICFLHVMFGVSLKYNVLMHLSMCFHLSATFVFNSKDFFSFLDKKKSMLNSLK